MLDTLAVYIPEDRRQAIARGEELPERMHGAALYADISGFTPLTEALVHHHGPQRGAEELTHHLDNVYNALVEQLNQYSGSVVGYSGDAITCWFDGDDGYRAIAAAIGMQSAMKQSSSIPYIDGETITLAVKVAIVVGDSLRLLVGDPTIQVFDVMGGSVSERLAVASHVVYSGEIVVDAETTTKLAEKLIVGEQRRSEDSTESFFVVAGLRETVTPTPWSEFSPGLLTEEQIRPWVLPAQYERVQQGHKQFMTELRPTVALFLRFGGIDYENNPAAGKQLDAYIRWVQTVFARYEGVLLQVLLGEKGSYIYGTFGAPVVHEDDARRALAAAYELSTTPESLSFIRSVSIGLSRGTMRTGPTGSTTRRTYGVLGDEVNVAARLMEAAGPSEIIATERVVQRVAGLFETLALPPLTVKGKSKPLPVYRIMGVVGQSRQVKTIKSGFLVGRAAERARLEDVSTELSHKQSNVVVIEGEAGIGKSHLVGEWLGGLDSHKVKILTGFSDAIEQSTPYHAWRPIFSQLFQWETSPDKRDGRRKYVLDQLQSLGLAGRAPLLNVVLPLDLPDNELTAEMAGKVRADNTHDVLVTLLQQAASTHPLLIVIEDSHWMDTASWSLAMTVARQVQPLLLTLVTRPLTTVIPSEYQSFLERPGTLHLQLDALTSADSIQLVCQRLGVDDLPKQVIELIIEKAEGHPFFSEELAYALRDSGVLRIVDNKATIASGVDFKILNLPDTVEGVVTSRIDMLTPGQQLTVKVASVIGRVFDYDVLEEVHPVATDRDRLPDYLDRLQNLDVTLLETPPPSLSYRFKHIITQEAVYNLLLFAQRRQLHQAVAEWYERVFASDLSPFYPLLAHHWLSVSETTTDDMANLKAIEYLEKAGDAAIRSYANKEAVEYFSKLLNMVTPQNKQSLNVTLLRMAQWEQQLGEAYNRLGNLVECEQHFGKSLAYLGWPLPDTAGRLLLAIVKQVVRQTRTRFKRTNKSIRTHLTDDDLNARRLACKIYERLGLLYFTTNNAGLMIYCPIASLNLAEEIGPSPELTIAYSYVTSAVGLIPVHRLARLYERLSLQTAEQVNNPLITARVLMAVSVYSTGTGRLGETEERLRRAIASFEQSGVWEWWGVCMEMLTRVKYYQGQFQQSAALADRLYTVSKKQDDIVQQSWSLTSRMETHLLLADNEDVLKLAAELDRFVSQVHETGPRQKLYGVSSLEHLQRREWTAADENARQLLNVIKNERPTSFGLLTGYVAAADTYLNLWEHQVLPDLTYLKQQSALACKLLKQFSQILPMGEPAKLRAQGLYTWLSGSHKQAQKLWNQSLIRAQAMHMPLDEALARYELGRHLPADDPDRRVYLEQARQLFKDMGVRYFEPRIQDALQGIPIG